MTAQDLFSLLNPLWLKHPGTRPRSGIEYKVDLGSFCDHDWDLVDLENVADLAAIAIVKWLAVRVGGFKICGPDDEGEWTVDCRGRLYFATSLLSALVSAAMAMEAE